MLPLLEIIQRTTAYFEKSGIENPRLDAQLLLAHVFDLSRMELYQQFDRPLEESELEKIRPLVRRRANREPLQYIVGSVEFLDLKLKVDRRSLIPRPETEELVDLLSKRQPRPQTILDLGTGSGALALGLASAFPEASVVAIDRSTSALELALENAEANHLTDRITFLEGNWFEPLAPDARFDWIVSNPPYLTEEEWQSAQPEVREWEPREALVAADEGCADLEQIFKETPNWLNPGGWLAVETGISQHRRLTEFAQECGFSKIESKQDLSGRDRFLIASYSEKIN